MSLLPKREIDRWLRWLALVPCLGLVGLLIYSIAVDGMSTFAGGLLIAMAAFAAGGFFGFLFGIPRSVLSGRTAGGYFRSSTSLEEIADWLTKILVGLGLASLGTLATRIGDLVNFFAPALGSNSNTDAVTLAILMLFSFSGFLLFYLTTRVHLAREFARAEEELQREKEKVEAVVTTLKEKPTTEDFLQQLRDERGPANGGS